MGAESSPNNWHFGATLRHRRETESIVVMWFGAVMPAIRAGRDRARGTDPVMDATR